MEHLKCICVSQMINKSKSFMTDRVSGGETQEGIIHGKYPGYFTIPVPPYV
jgi:hypothetical protein